jgi:AAA+ ATPase superfamily predicted ATPase
MTNIQNPFKFGSIVKGDFFTDRVEELAKVSDVINSENHLILISPRRFGKTSLISKAVKQTKRPEIFLNLQLTTSISDFAIELLKKVFKVYPFEKIKQLVKNFRIIPTLSINPVSNVVDVSFSPVVSAKPILEDVLNLINHLGKKGEKPIVIFDEFQEIRIIDKNLDKVLRSIIQTHSNVNYLFLGSLESMMHEIFERKKSPFYHFGIVMTLATIETKDFYDFLFSGFSKITSRDLHETINEIINITKGHPYYTQQLAFHCFNAIKNGVFLSVDQIIQQIVEEHTIDYERLWINLSIKERFLLIEMIQLKYGWIQRKDINIPTSTRYSAYKKLLTNGFLIQISKNYQLEDPFFERWILNQRS